MRQCSSFEISTSKVGPAQGRFRLTLTIRTTRSKALVLSLLLISAASHSALAAKSKEPDFRVWTERDSFKPGVVVVRSTPITIKNVQFLNPWFAFLEAGYIYSENGSFGTYFFDVFYHGSDWMFWDQLTAKIGTEVQSLELVGQPRRDAVALGVEERVRFEVPRDFFEKIAAAPSVDFRVNGKYYYDFFLNSTGTSYLSQVKNFVRENAPEMAPAKAVAPQAPDGKEAAGSAAPSYVQELRELAKLRAEGVISEEDFQAKKRLLLGLDTPATTPPTGGTPEEKPKEKGEPEAPPASTPPPNPAL
jgi:hypothetical protein